MHLLTPHESAEWSGLTAEIAGRSLEPGAITPPLRANMIPLFHYHVGAVLSSGGRLELGREWFRSGVFIEGDGLFSNAFFSSFLDRHDGRLDPPAVVFADPRPYMHFTTVPVMRDARERFIRQLCNTMPRFDHPVRFMDIGCGDGSLTAGMLRALRAAGKVGDIAEVMLVDGSAGMIDMARGVVGGVVPQDAIRSAVHRIEEISHTFEGRYDIAVSSLAYHHMPWETKLRHLTNLKPHIDHFVLFELDANNDTPERDTPELSVSVYQSYGRLMDFIFQHDAPLELAVSCVDQFLIPENISLLTEPRGVRRDYHMLHAQWQRLFEEVLAPEFHCWSNSINHGDEYFSLFTMHYGRD